MYNCIQPPLRVRLAFRPQRESAHPFVNADVRKHRLDNPQPPCVDFPVLGAVDFGFHLVRHVRLRSIYLDREIAARGSGFAQAALPHGTGGAVFRSGMVDVVHPIAVALIARLQAEFLAIRTDVDLSGVVALEIVRREQPPPLHRPLPAMDTVLEALLLGEAFIPLAELDVGDGGVHACGLAKGQAVETVLVAVGGQLLAFEVVFALAQVFLRRLKHRLQVFVVVRAERLCRQDDLMLGIDRRLSVVALQDAVRGGHLDRFVVHRVALDFPAVAALLGLLAGEKLVQPFDLTLETLLPLFEPLCVQLRELVCSGVVVHHLLELLLQRIALAFEFIEPPDPLFGDVRRAFDSVQAEVAAAQQSQLVAQQRYVAEHALDFLLHRRDERRDGAVVGGRIRRPAP